VDARGSVRPRCEHKFCRWRPRRTTGGQRLGNRGMRKKYRL